MTVHLLFIVPRLYTVILLLETSYLLIQLILWNFRLLWLQFIFCYLIRFNQAYRLLLSNRQLVRTICLITCHLFIARFYLRHLGLIELPGLNCETPILVSKEIPSLNFEFHRSCTSSSCLYCCCCYRFLAHENSCMLISFFGNARQALVLARLLSLEINHC